MKIITLTNFNALRKGDVSVDAENAVIKNVSIIQKGEALGHGFIVDDVMMKQVHDSISAQAKGVRSRLTHPGLTDCGGFDGVEVLLGRAKATALDGDKVRGDLHIGRFASITPAGDLKSYLLAVAEDDPEMLGLSIVFESDEFAPAPKGADKDPTWAKDADGNPLPLGRVKRVVAADVVGDPAANRDGLLSKLTATFQKRLGADALKPWIEYLQNYTGGVLPPPIKQEVLMNPKVKAYLLTLGLAATATDEVAKAFLESLSSDVKAKALAEANANAPAKLSDGSPDKFCSQCGTQVMSDSKYCASCGASQTPPAALSNQPKKDADTLRKESLEELSAMGEMGKDWVNLHFLQKTSLEDARNEVVKKLSDKNKPVGSIVVGVERKTLGIPQAIQDTLRLRAGRPIYEVDSLGRVVMETLADGTKQPKQRNPHERHREFSGLSLYEMARHCLATAGVDLTGLSRPQVAKLAFDRHAIADRAGGNVRLFESTADFANILADMQNKDVGVFFQLAPDTTYWCRSRPIKDFKQASTVKLSAAPKLTQVTAGAKYEFYSFGDQGEKYTLAKYGYIIGFNWETLINDDLDVLMAAPQAIAMAAKALKMDLVYGILTGNPNMADNVALFHATHGNLQSGGGSALSLTSWATCEQQMVTQTSNGQLINARPKFLIIPYVLRQNAANILYPNALLANKSGIVTTQSNPYSADPIQVVPEARLDVASSTAWYAAADPGMVDTIEIGYLEGEPEPVVEQDAEFSRDSRQLKVRYTIAAKAADSRGLQKSAGA